MLTAKKVDAINLLMTGMKKEDVCKTLDISSKTLCNWQNDDEFIKAYNKAISKKFIDINPAIVNRLIEIANSKNENVAVAACKELLSRGGLAAVQKIETDGKIVINVDITSDTEDELDADSTT